jgi:hypothetical protein
VSTKAALNGKSPAHKPTGEPSSIFDRGTSDNDSGSVFQLYLRPEVFSDRFASNPAGAIDVLIPVMHTNDLWRKNLLSIYREIPVHRLLLGDGGCIDKTLEIAREFPRVHTYDHRDYVSLGYSIRKLIEMVETEWFVYLHSDVYLPPGWFDVMRTYQGQYDWCECLQHVTVMLDYPVKNPGSRAYSGSQMGRKKAFETVLPKIDDDFLYRNEDIILAELVKATGGRYGRVLETFYYHQQMPRKSLWERNVRVSFEVAPSPAEETRESLMQAKGLVKYLKPTPDLAYQVGLHVRRLIQLGVVTWPDFKKWAEEVNPEWKPFLGSSPLKPMESNGQELHQLITDRRLHPDVRSAMMQAKGLVKYLEPTWDLAVQVRSYLKQLLERKAITRNDFEKWVEETNPAWLPFLRPTASETSPRLRARLGRVKRAVLALFNDTVQLARSLLAVVTG